jgi:hypothetical protein
MRRRHRKSAKLRVADAAHPFGGEEGAFILKYFLVQKRDEARPRVRTARRYLRR